MTMNEQDDETRHSYNRYANEVQQVEWEKTEQVRKLRWVEDSLRQALAEFDAEQACPTCSIAHTDGSDCQRDASQAQHMVPEHTHGMAVTADDTVTHDVDDVKPRVEERKEPDPNCGWCLRAGMVDSGGFTPWDQPIDVACACTYVNTLDTKGWGVGRGLTQADLIDIADCVEYDQQDEWDEEWDDLMSREELERAERETEEERDDH